jgi:hypothetical protein
MRQYVRSDFSMIRPEDHIFSNHKRNAFGSQALDGLKFLLYKTP